MCYKINKIIFCNEQEKEELINDNFTLLRIFHVDTWEEIPSDYNYRYVVGVDIDLY